MSAFLFYKPNSNPGRYSRKERFSLRCNPSSPAGSSNKQVYLNQRELHSVEAIVPNLTDRSELCEIPTAESMPTFHRDLLGCQEATDSFNDTFSEHDDEHNSLHSLFSEPDTYREGIILGPAEVQCDRVIPEQTYQDNTAHPIRPCELPRTDTGTSVVQSHAGRSLSNQLLYEPTVDEPRPAPVSIESSHKGLQGISNPVADVAFPLLLTSHPGSATTEPSCVEGHLSTIDHVDIRTSSFGQEKHSPLEERDAHMRDSIEPVPNYTTVSAVLVSGESNLQLNEWDLPSDTYFVPGQQSCHNSPRLTNAADMENQQSDNNATGAYINPTAAQERNAVSKSNGNAHCGLRIAGNSGTVFPRYNTEIELHEEAPRFATVLDNGLHREPSVMELDKHAEETTHGGPNREPCLPSREGSAVSSSYTEGYLPNINEQWNPVNPRPRAQKKYVEFSHVEIRNSAIESGRHVLGASEETFDAQTGCSYHHSLASGPWRLDGTTLSVDIREAERTPVFMGYSTFRVINGELCQSVTLVQGNVTQPPTGKSRNPTCKVEKQNVSRARRARKTCRALPATTSRSPLTREQKEGLVRLREEGLTWNEIASRFPNRKKGTLQAVYYSCLKSSSDQITKLPHYTGRHPERQDRQSYMLTKQANHSIGSRIQPTRMVKNSRYSFRPRCTP
ncbi:hypothetical protein BDV33DRAFT_206884 [Aspergillus novoparasiticus]|uniref:Myb-like domain-containing protein n=1 Tax=Aspergillus novoparasiticus TaxID=986946 RepID=A0A5N6EIA8_9EURO|nr:hypothetical protein BDV33DRAFT_206884 [Aspergillus novoparasiticus]